MEFEYIELLHLVLSFLTSFGITFSVMPFLIRYLKRKNIVGIDIHKLSKPEIPAMGGLAILLGLISSQVLNSFLLTDYTNEFLAFISVILIAGGIGIYDDLKELGPKIKPFLLIFAVIPLLYFGVVMPRPLLPLIGRTRLTIIYWVVLPLVIAVPSNAVNMLDVLNGSMAWTCLIASAALLICAILMDSIMGILLSVSLLGTLLAFLKYNNHPAKVFPGDVGSLTVGSAIGAIAILGRLEIAAIIALMPHIMNAFHFLTSSRGLKAGKKFPTKVLPDGKLEANPERDAPITLTRLILARGPLTELEIVKIFGIITLFCGILAIISVGVTPR